MGDRFRDRVATGHALTLIHGDMHLLGNVFFAKHTHTAPAIKLIDWGQAKQAMGPHDLMYALLSVAAPDRIERDTHLLQRYHDGLQQGGIRDYPWEQCCWDYRFSLLTNLYQAIWQQSLTWFRKTMTVITIWEAEDLLHSS